MVKSLMCPFRHCIPDTHINILAGWYFSKLSEQSIWYSLLRWIHIVLNFVLVLMSVLALVILFPTKSIFMWAPLLIGILGLAYLYKTTKGKQQVYLTTSLAFGVLMFVFSFHFLPSALTYDGPYKAAIKSKELNAKRIISNNVQSLAFDIYSNQNVEYKDIFQLQDLTNNGVFIFVHEGQLKDVLSTYEEKRVLEFSHHAATNLSLSFLLESQRKSSLEKFYLVEI